MTKSPSERKFSVSAQTVVRLIGRFRAQFAVLCVIEVCSASFSLAAPYFSKLYVDQAFLGRDLDKFIRISVWGAGVFLFSITMYYIASIVKQRLRLKLSLAVKNNFLKHLFSLNLESLQLKSSGENAQRILDIEELSYAVIDELPGLFSSAIVFIFSLAVSCWIDVRLTFFVIVLSPLFLFKSAYFQEKMRRAYEDMWNKAAAASSHLLEALRAKVFIKSYALETFQRHQIMRETIAYLRLKALNFRWELASYISSAFLGKVIYGAVMLYGGWLVLQQKTTLGNYSAVMLYLTSIGSFAEGLGSRIENAALNRVRLKHFFEILEEPSEEDAMESVCRPQMLRGEVHFMDVSFGYTSRQDVFSHASFLIPAQSWVGVVGMSGCGKTTLVSLLSRLFDNWRGHIKVDGADLHEYDPHHLRRKISLVSQYPVLFNLSIRENLVCGRMHIDRKRIEECAAYACIHDDIMQLPQGYETVIGEEAYRLSQGQKQRLAIARALLRDPDILILDEATAWLNAATEAAVLKGVRSIRGSRTTIIISHHLFPIEQTDTVIFFKDDGHIVQGRHSSLWADEPAYRNFFESGHRD